MSIHIGANAGEIAPQVLLPGDPLRARHIAQTFLTSPKQFNEIRGMLGYTGLFRGSPVSVMGTGMGIPSMAIYATELLAHYGVQTLVRVGTCGSFSAAFAPRSLLLPDCAATDSAVADTWFAGVKYSAVPDFSLLRRAADCARKIGKKPVIGGIFTTDLFYNENSSALRARLSAYGIRAVDMETYALFCLAKKFDARALCICTVSDCLETGAQISAVERQTAFDDMTELALETLFDGREP